MEKWWEDSDYMGCRNRRIPNAKQPVVTSVIHVENGYLV